MSSPATDALVHYLSQARLAEAMPASLVQLCVEATEDPNLYVFSELLEDPTIRTLSRNEHCVKYIRLLRLFAYGTVKKYQRLKDQYPPLTDRQLNKLRILTLVSLAAGHSELSYQQLRDALAVQSTRQVEDVVIDAVYAGLLRARMNQHAGTVEIYAVEGRDVNTGSSIEPMINTLNQFLERCSRLVSQIDDKMEFIATHTNRAKEQKQRAAAQLGAMRSAVRNELTRETRQSRLRNKTSDEDDIVHYHQRDTRSMRARRTRSADTDGCD